MRCTRCSSEITIKTDPENSDYVCEMGAVRNYESTIKKEGTAKEDARKKREDEEEGNAMKVLENRTMDNKMVRISHLEKLFSNSRKEMDILDGLDEIRTLNARMTKLDTDELLNRIILAKEEHSDDDEEMEVLSKLKQQNLNKRVDVIEEEIIEDDWMTKKPKQSTSEDGFKIPPKPKQIEKQKKQSKIGLGGPKKGVTLKFPAQSRSSAVILPEDEDVQTEGGFNLVSY